MSDLIANDCGTENNIRAGIQYHFANDISAHKYGSSPSNQPIENFGPTISKDLFFWIIELFKDFVDSGQFQLGNYVHMECIWVSFASLIQSELNEVKRKWNTHLIRKSRNDTVRAQYT